MKGNTCSNATTLIQSYSFAISNSTLFQDFVKEARPQNWRLEFSRWRAVNFIITGPDIGQPGASLTSDIIQLQN